MIQKNQKGEKRKHERSSSNHEQRRRKRWKKRKSAEKSDSEGENQHYDDPKDSPVHVDEAKGCGTSERRSDNAAYKPMEEAEIYDVPCGTGETSAKTPQLKRPSESYTTGVPTKRINKEKPH